MHQLPCPYNYLRYSGLTMLLKNVMEMSSWFEMVNIKVNSVQYIGQKGQIRNALFFFVSQSARQAEIIDDLRAKVSRLRVNQQSTPRHAAPTFYQSKPGYTNISIHKSFFHVILKTTSWHRHHQSLLHDALCKWKSSLRNMMGRRHYMTT